jgi:AcrR family transcriptional regulator
MTAAAERRNAGDGRVRRGMRTRSLLLDAAIDLFGSRGFKATSMRDIEARAGVCAPAVYDHLPSKDAVLVAALVTRLQRFRDAVLVPDDPTKPPAVRLEGVVRRHIAQQIGSGTMVEAIIGFCDRCPGWYRGAELRVRRAQDDCWLLVTGMVGLTTR